MSHRFAATCAGSVPVTVVPVPGDALDRERAAERGHPVLHDPQPLAALGALHLEARPAVADGERHLARPVGERHVDSSTRGMPLGVLERLDAAEVDRRLDRRRRSACPVEPPRIESWVSLPARRASAPSAAASPSSDSSGGKIPRATSRRSSSATVVRSLSRSRDARTPSGSATTRAASSRISSRIAAISAPTPSRSSCSRRCRCASRTVTRRSRERRSSSVCAESSSARRCEVDGEARVLETDARVRREVVEQRPLGRPEGIAGRLRDREIPDRLAAVLDRQRQVGLADVGLRRPRRRPDPVGALGTGQEHPDAGGARTRHPAPPPPPCPGAARSTDGICAIRSPNSAITWYGVDRPP